MAGVVSPKTPATNVPSPDSATQAWVNTYYGSKTSDGTQVFRGPIQAPSVITPVNVKSFGALGNGTHDDTQAIQNAVNKCLTTTGGYLYIPGGTYLLSSAINIPFSTQWVIAGDSRGNTTLKQSAGNTPVFKITNSNTWGWALKDLQFTSSASQVSTNIQAAGVWVSNNANVYNWVIERCYFDKLVNGVYADAGTVFWGGTMRDCVFNTQMTRSVIQIVTGGGGMPNNKFENLYIRADRMVGPLFDMAACETTWLTGIEINQALLGPTILKDTAGGSYAIGTLKMEVGTYSGSVTPFFSLSGVSGFQAQYIHLATITSVSPSGSNYIFSFGSGTGRARISRLHLPSWSVSSGTYLVFDGTGGSSNLDVKIDSMDAVPGNVALTPITLDASADHVQVSSWNAGVVSADQGDASVTVSPSPTQPNILVFATTLTATRAVQLPGSAASPGNIFNGLKYRVVRTAGGAFDLQVKDGASTVLDSIPAGYKGSIEYTYRRQAWVQTDKELLPSTSLNTVVQATNKATAVTLNAGSGQITMNNAALNAGTSVAFAVNNTEVGANDVVVAFIKSGFATGATYRLDPPSGLIAGSGGFWLNVTNISAGALSEALVISFVVIKST